MERSTPLRWVLLIFPFLAQAAEASSGIITTFGVSVPKIFLNTTEGTTLLQKATHNAPFYKLVPHFVTENPGMCGPSTAVMVMNALASDGLKAPISQEYSMGNTTYHYWEQRNVWTAFDAACVRGATTPWFGSLEQVVKGFLQCRGVEAEPILALNSSESAFRTALMEAFSGQSLSYVGVNFHRQLLGQEGYGHHSPVGAYDKSTDQVLIMDVARYKYPPVWVHLADLWNAMSGDAPSGGKGWDTPRGFFVAKMPATAGTSDGLVLI